MTTARMAFDRLAPTYDALVAGEAFQLQRRQTHRLLARWIRPGFRVLEIGCGTGADTEFLAALGARVVACDPSEEMLSRTKRRLEAAGFGDRAGRIAVGQPANLVAVNSAGNLLQTFINGNPVAAH